MLIRTLRDLKHHASHYLVTLNLDIPFCKHLALYISFQVWEMGVTHYNIYKPQVQDYYIAPYYFEVQNTDCF